MLILRIIGAAFFIFQVIHLEKGGGDNSNADTILNNVLFKEMKAVKNHRVLHLTSDLWYLSGRGLESTKLILEDIQKLIQ